MKRIIIIQVAFLAVLLVMVVLGACTKRSKQKSVVEEWVGKELIIPDGLTFQIQDIPISYDFNNADFKIVTYIDSTGCTNCKMKLHEWNRFIDDIKKITDAHVNFLMIINSSRLNKIKFLLKSNYFSNVVSIDTHDIFNKSNKLSIHSRYHTFLIDKNNKILAIGNPVYNSKIRRLYGKIITEYSINH